ncbi:hypothetical protein HUU61_16440 [Rhodopseudomonas palustris]|nr:hypothetical protein [Rhodopseudomonas palustris]
MRSAKPVGLDHIRFENIDRLAICPTSSLPPRTGPRDDMVAMAIAPEATDGLDVEPRPTMAWRRYAAVKTVTGGPNLTV